MHSHLGQVRTMELMEILGPRHKQSGLLSLRPRIQTKHYLQIQSFRKESSRITPPIISLLWTTRNLRTPTSPSRKKKMTSPSQMIQPITNLNLDQPVKFSPTDGAHFRISTNEQIAKMKILKTKVMKMMMDIVYRGVR